jgi:cell division protein ZapE
MQAYDLAVSVGKLENDSAQRDLAQRLSALAKSLASHNGSFVKKLLPITKKEQRGLYIWGPVGRGKTMLMDMFFSELALAKKRRAHFHAFMRDVHERIFRERQKSEGDPLIKVADDIAREAQVLCFDEFAVTDVADAMILSRLFAQLFKQGVTVVSTSNMLPDELYKGGLNRSLFEPFIKQIKKKMDVVRCEAKKDFRLESLSKSGVYFTGAEAQQKLEAAWRDQLQDRAEQSEDLRFKGRHLPVPRAVPGICRFTFAELCEAPLGAEDYLELSAEFHTLFLEGILYFNFENRNALRRFINLIDILYDRGVKLIASAEAEPGELVTAMDGFESQAYQRTASRLIEMRSNTYLTRQHLPEPLESKAYPG